MHKRTASKHVASAKPKVSELRKRFEFIKASFAIEDMQFSDAEILVFEESIAKRHRGPGLAAASAALLVGAKSR